MAALLKRGRLPYPDAQANTEDRSGFILGKSAFIFLWLSVEKYIFVRGRCVIYSLYFKPLYSYIMGIRTLGDTRTSWSNAQQHSTQLQCAANALKVYRCTKYHSVSWQYQSNPTCIRQNRTAYSTTNCTDHHPIQIQRCSKAEQRDISPI